MATQNIKTITSQEIEKLKQLLQKNGSFIAQFEIGQEKILRLQQQMNQYSANQQQQIEDQLNAVKQHTDALHELMTETGAARFRLVAEHNLQIGEQHLQQISHLCLKQQKQFEQQQKKLDELAEQHLNEIKQLELRVAQRIQNFLEQLNITEMRELADNARNSIENYAIDSVQQSKKLLRKFHWKNFLLILSLVVLNTLAMGLYISDEMPWEIHQHAVQERKAGQTLLNAWPTLEDETKHKILAHSTKAHP